MAELVILTEKYGYKLENGLWKDPYTRVFSPKGGGSIRIAEISNFPRVTLNPKPPVYLQDTLIAVTPVMATWWSEKQQEYVYREHEEVDGAWVEYRVGEMVLRRKGEPLPGPYPKWVEMETVQEPTHLDRYRFPLNLPAARAFLDAALHEIDGQEVVVDKEMIARKFLSDEVDIPAVNVVQRALFILYARL